LQIAVSIPIKGSPSTEGGTRSAIPQQVGFGSLLNLLPAMTVANFVCHDVREFRFVIGGQNQAPCSQEESTGQSERR
jgi:hypothetical protein